MLAAGGAERLRHRGDLRTGEIPSAPSEISPQWLTAALCAGAPGAWVRSVERSGASAGTTTRQSLEVSYNEAGKAAGLPTQLFVKCTATVAQRLMLGLGGFIEGEPGFYAHVRPQLRIEAPIGYFGAVDRRTWRSVVVIEDVAATRGARFWDPSTQVTRAQLEDLLGNVAIWHGALWQSPALAQWGWLRTPADQVRLIDALIGMADRTRAGFERARSVIPAALRERQRDLYLGMRRSMLLAAEGPATYLHGDLHIANTYVTASEAIGVADWQIGLRGCWAYDYAYLIASALEPDDRRAHEHQLLDFYLGQLARSGGPTICHRDGWEAYRRATLYPYFAWIYTIGRSRLQPRFQPAAVSLTMIRRISTAIDDLCSLEAVGL